MSSDRIRSRARALTYEDEIVISGISGKFPSSSNMYEFADNLYNKVREFFLKVKNFRANLSKMQVDMVDDDERRWRHTNPEVFSSRKIIKILQYKKLIFRFRNVLASLRNWLNLTLHFLESILNKLIQWIHNVAS